MKLNDQLIKFTESLTVNLPYDQGLLPFSDYTSLHCNMSGGKDSIGLVLLLLFGYKVPKEKIQLVHMRIDGAEHNPASFDWPQTDQYLRYVAKKLDLPLVIIHSDMGLEDRIWERGMWPSSKAQFCTSYQKRDVYARWVRQQGSGRYLCCSGERSQESARRKNKPTFEIYKPAHAETKQRYVHWFRPIHHLHLDQVWNLMRLADIDPHPCYQYVSRCSCRFCIFLSPLEMKKVSELYPEDFQRLVKMEKQMGHSYRYDKGIPVALEDFIARADGYEDQTSFDLFTPPCMN